MKSKQPNFEIVKTAFYQQFIDSIEANSAILFDSSKGKLLPSFTVRKRSFAVDFNQWLDRIDIRCVGNLIDILIEKGTRLPEWIREKKYIIDYNGNGFLDLIKR